jgi:O-acetylserine/cysteine efflux transporter
MKARPLHLAVAGLATMIFGMQWVASRAAQTEIPPFFIVCIRLVFIAILLCPFARIPRGTDWTRLLFIATLVSGLNLPLTYLGVKYVDASTGALTYQLYTPIVVAMSMIFLKEKLEAWAAAGIAIALAGVGVIAGWPGERADPIGVAAIILGAASFAAASMLMRHWSMKDAMQLQAWSSLLGLPFPVALTLAFESGQLIAVSNASAGALLALSYICTIGGLVGFFLWYWVSARAPASAIAPLSFLNPVAAVAGGVLLLGEPLTLTRILGAIMIVGGVAIIQWPRKAEAIPER